MRKDTVSLITGYMIAGIVFNALAMMIIHSLNISTTEQIMTVIVSNAGFVAMARYFAINHEMKCDKQHRST